MERVRAEDLFQTCGYSPNSATNRPATGAAACHWRPDPDQRGPNQSPSVFAQMNANTRIPEETPGEDPPLTNEPQEESTGDILAQLTQADVATIRKTTEQPPRVSVIDAIQVLTRSLYAKNIWRDLMTTFPEVVSLVHSFKFPGQGQRMTPVTDAQGIVQIIMLLPGKNETNASLCLKLANILGQSVDVMKEAVLKATLRPIPRRVREREETTVLRWLEGFAYKPQVSIEGKRVDAVVRLAKKMRAIVEVDEKQHRSYGLPAEIARMQLIKHWAEKQGGTTWLLRFNPHDHNCGGRKIRVSSQTSKDSFLAALRAMIKISNATNLAAFHIVFLYYDSDDRGQPLIAKDPHMPHELRTCIRQFDLASQGAFMQTSGDCKRTVQCIQEQCTPLESDTKRRKILADMALSELRVDEKKIELEERRQALTKKKIELEERRQALVERNIELEERRRALE